MWKGHLGSVENIVLAHPTKGSEILPGVISTMHWPVLYCRCHRGPGSSMLCACWPGVWTFSELNLKKPTSYWDLVSTRNSFSFSYKLSFFGVCFCFCQKGISAQSDFHGLPWHGPGASSRPVCVLGPLPSVTACLSDSPGPGRGDPLQEEVFTRDFPSIWKPDLCLKAIYVPPLFKKKGKPHLEVIYLVIAHYLQLISIRASWSLGVLYKFKCSALNQAPGLFHWPWKHENVVGK